MRDDEDVIMKEATLYRTPPLRTDIEDIVMGEVQPVFLVAGHGCEFGGFYLPANIRLIMHGESEILMACRLAINELYIAGHFWSSYKDLLQHLGEPQYQHFHNFRIYNYGDYVPNILITMLRHDPQGVFQLPIRTDSYRYKVGPDAYITLKQVVDLVASRGGGTIFLIACREPCAKTELDSLLADRQDIYPAKSYDVGEPILKYIKLKSDNLPFGLIAKRGPNVVFAYGNSYFVFDSNTGKTIEDIKVYGSELIFIGYVGRKVIYADEFNLYSSLPTTVTPQGVQPVTKEIVASFQLTPEGNVIMWEGGRPMRLFVVPDEFALLRDNIGLSIIDGNLIFLQVRTVSSLVLAFPHAYPGEIEKFKRNADWNP